MAKTCIPRQRQSAPSYAVSGSCSRRERELCEARRRAVAVKVDGALDALDDDEGVAVQRDERGREHRPHELPDGGAQRTGDRVGEPGFVAAGVADGPLALAVGSASGG